VEGNQLWGTGWAWGVTVRRWTVAGTLCLDLVGLTPRKNQYLNEVQGVRGPEHVAAHGAGSWTGHRQWGKHR
jgi:hypothetical protein